MDLIEQEIMPLFYGQNNNYSRDLAAKYLTSTFNVVIIAPMNTKNIIGRTKECDRLEACMESDNAQLIIVYGRRRVGKTFLINEFFSNKFAFKLTGTYGQDKDVQLIS